MLAEAPRDKPDCISRETFKDWTKTCGSRRVQDAYEEIAQEARRNNCSALKAMKEKGYKDFHDFSKACPQFDLKCWPIDFAELGSGYVLYFHFLAFLAALLGLMFLLQVPALFTYSQADSSNLCRWGGVEDWQQLYRTSAGDAGTNASCGNHSYVSFHYLTPGNLGPDSTSSSILTAVYLGCIVLVCAAAFSAYQHAVLTEHQVDAKTVSPNDFAVLVRGLPESATDEKAIAEFFREHAVEGSTDTQIVKVVIGWDACEFRENTKEIRSIKQQLTKTDPESEQYAQLTARMQTINQVLSSVGKADGQAARLKSSGTVVVIFRYGSDMRGCLKKWGSLQSQWLYRQPKDVCLLPAGNGLQLGEELPRFPIGEPPVPVYKLYVERSANPGDINWEELGVDWDVKMKMQLKTNAMMFAIIILCFFITYGLNKLQDFIREAKEENDSSGTALSFVSLLPAIGIAATNVFLCIVAKKQADKEYHDTFTDQEFSQALKMTVGMIINTAGVTYFSNAQPMDWYKSGGLVDDMVSVMGFQCLLSPLIFYLDPGWAIKGFQRRKLTDEKLEAFNANLNLGPPKSKEAFKQRTKVLDDIEYFKRAFAPNSMNNPRRYASALKNFVVCMMFMPLIPWLAAIGCLGLVLQYRVDKYLMLRWQSRPARPANSNMATFALKGVKLTAPLGLAVFSFVFLCPSWEDKAGLWAHFYSSAIFALVVSFFFPYSVWSKILFPCLGISGAGAMEEDYYKAQFMWAKEMKYHKDQFIYRKLPEKDNPEYLKEGEETVVKVDVAAAAMGAAAVAAGAAAAAAHGRPAALPGGKIVEDVAAAPSATGASATSLGGSSAATGGDVETGEPTYGVPVLGPLPTIVGASSAPTVPSPALAASAAAEPPPEAPAEELAAAGLPAVSTGEPPASLPRPQGMTAVKTQIWEFKVRAGWESFDCSAQLELHRLYAEFMAGGASHVTITSSGRQISIYFDKMTSMLASGKDRVREIRHVKASE